MDRETSSRPERRTALVAKELSRYNIDIAALSETKLADEGSVAEPKGGYTFFWKGKDQDDEGIHGIGLAIRSNLLQQLPGIPTAINKRLMKLRFPLNTSRNITVISAYAPTKQWDQFSTMVKETAQSTLGPKKRVHQDWFDENDEAITQLLDEKQKAFYGLAE
ncbi:hypothetical protein ACOMHN_001245 [Nucella lapillus]